jgi:hypothetical protein
MTRNAGRSKGAADLELVDTKSAIAIGSVDFPCLPISHHPITPVEPVKSCLTWDRIVGDIIASSVLF